MSRTAGVLTVSDGVAGGNRIDLGGAAIADLCREHGFDVNRSTVVGDEIDDIRMAIMEMTTVCDLILTTGGTGFGPRDVTPEATRPLLDKEAPGVQMLMLNAGLASTPMAALSRGVVGSIGRSMVVNLPGSPKGAVENLTAILDLVPHVLDLLGGNTEHR